MEDEEERLREENGKLRSEMAKMDKLVYGTAKSSSNRPGSARGVSRSATRESSVPRAKGAVGVKAAGGKRRAHEGASCKK